MEGYGKEYQTDNDIIKSILCSRLAMYAQMLRYLKERELPPLPKKVLKQVGDSIRQAERTIEEISDWSVPMEMNKTMAGTIGLPSDNGSPVMDCETYVVVEIGKLCETIWEISRFVIFDGKISQVPFKPSSPFSGMCSCGASRNTQPPGPVPPYTPPPYGQPFPHSVYPRW